MGDSCTDGNDKDNLQDACRGPTPAPTPFTCSSMQWGSCSPSPWTGSCLDHLTYSIRSETMTCSAALDEIRAQCEGCNVCTEADCPADVRAASNLHFLGKSASGWS